jgi:hypothetical protein
LSSPSSPSAVKLILIVAAGKRQRLSFNSIAALKSQDHLR